MRYSFRVTSFRLNAKRPCREIARRSVQIETYARNMCRAARNFTITSRFSQQPAWRVRGRVRTLSEHSPSPRLRVRSSSIAVSVGKGPAAARMLVNAAAAKGVQPAISGNPFRFKCSPIVLKTRSSLPRSPEIKCFSFSWPFRAMRGPTLWSALPRIASLPPLRPI